MKRAPLNYRLPPWSKEKLARLNEIKRDFHVRAFGEELARVNLDMTIEERHQYLNWMRELADKNGVPRPKRRFEDLEEEESWKRGVRRGQHALPQRIIAQMCPVTLR